MWTQINYTTEDRNMIKGLVKLLENKPENSSVALEGFDQENVIFKYQRHQDLFELGLATGALFVMDFVAKNEAIEKIQDYKQAYGWPNNTPSDYDRHKYMLPKSYSESNNHPPSQMTYENAFREPINISFHTLDKLLIDNIAETLKNEFRDSSVKYNNHESIEFDIKLYEKSYKIDFTFKDPVELF